MFGMKARDPRHKEEMDYNILKPDWKSNVKIELREDWSLPEYSNAKSMLTYSVATYGS